MAIFVENLKNITYLKLPDTLHYIQTAPSTDPDVVTISSSDEEDEDGLSSSRQSESASIKLAVGSSTADSQVGDEDEEDDDDCIVISEPSDEEGDDDDTEVDDPTNSGMHTNDLYNIPDDQGRVLINVGKPETEPDIFLAPQIARVIKPHQVSLINCWYSH